MQDIDNRNIYKIYFYWILFVLAWNYHFTYVEWKLLLLHANNIDYLFKFALRCLNFLVMIILKVWKIWWDNADLANKKFFFTTPFPFFGFLLSALMNFMLKEVWQNISEKTLIILNNNVYFFSLCMTLYVNS